VILEIIPDDEVFHFLLVFVTFHTKELPTFVHLYDLPDETAVLPTLEHLSPDITAEDVDTTKVLKPKISRTKTNVRFIFDPYLRECLPVNYL
jgi:hypothetical protein